jgi:hypothetical protein
MRSEANAPKNGEQTVGFSFTTMLQLIGRFWSKIYYQRTMGQPWSFHHTLLTWPQLTFTRSLDWNQHWRGGAYVNLMTSFSIRQKSWKGSHKMVSRNVSNNSTAAGRNVYLRKGLYWGECCLNDFDVLYFSEIKRFREIFECTSKTFDEMRVVKICGCIFLLCTALCLMLTWFPATTT